MAFDMPYGPWSELATASWHGQELSVYTNPDKLVLILVKEKKGEQVVGALVLIKKIFVVEGELSKFLLMQKREMNVLEKRSKDFSLKYLLFTSTPAYVEFKEKELADAVRKQYGELQAISKDLPEVLAEFNVKARDFSEATSEESAGLLEDPLTIFSFAAPAKGVPEKPRFFIGLNKEGRKAQIELSALSKLVVVGGTREKRLHALHILCEGALLNNVPCMVFDSTNSFKGLAVPAKSGDEHVTPTAFPFKSFELGKGLFIDLSTIDPQVFTESLELNTDVATPIKSAYSKKVAGIADLATELSELKESREASKYLINKAARVAQVLQKSFPGVFAKNIVSELEAPWIEGVGKAVYINLAGNSKNIQFLLIYSLLASLRKPASKLAAIIVLEQEASELPKKLFELIQSFQGIGVVLHSQNDLSELKEANKIELVDGEAIVSIKESKPQRVTLRKAHSQCAEFH